MLKLARTGGGPTKITIPMAPMIAIAVQMLMLVLLNLKLVAPGGDFRVHMPVGAPVAVAEKAPPTPEIKVRLLADDAGRLSQVMLGDHRLGNDDQAFDRLNGIILEKLGPSGQVFAKDVEIEIDADYGLRYEYVIKAVSNCTGRLDSQGNLIRYVEKIKFAPPRKKA